MGDLLHCYICGQSKPKSEFYKDRGRNSGHQSHCKECNNKRTRSPIKQRARLQRARKRRTIANKVAFKKACCAICGYDKCEAALEYHHTGMKKELPSVMIRRAHPDKVAQELSQCIVVCANCHREIHADLIDILLGCKAPKDYGHANLFAQ